MLNVKRFWYEYKSEIIITILGALAGIFAVFGRDVAFCMWAPDGILVFCSETSKIIVGSLLFPLVMVICGVVFRDTRQKVVAIIYSKLALEIILISVGVNLNCLSPVFWGDLSSLFFIFVDAILLLSLLSEKVEKAVSGGVLIAVFTVSLLTLAINRKNADTLAYTFRLLYICLIYLTLFIGIKYLLWNTHRFDALIAFKDKWMCKEGVIKLVSVLFMIALSAAFTLCFVMVSGHSGIIPIKERPIELSCYISWCALYLLVAVFVHNSTPKTSMIKNIIFASCVATASTITVMLLNSYGHLLEFFFWFGDEIELRYYGFFMSDLTYTYSFGWLRYPAVFMMVFLVSFIIFVIINNRRDDDIGESVVNKNDFSFDSFDEDFDEHEDGVTCFDFERKKTPDKDWNSVFDGDTFAMDDKEYDILLTFDNDDETEKYIVYTDNSLDEEGKVQIFASKYNPEISTDKLIPVEQDEEWEAIKGLLDYAMEKALENSEKSEKTKERSEVKLDTFTTLCYLANAIAQEEDNKVPFILATRGEGIFNDTCGVALKGTTEELKEVLKYTMMSVAKRFKSEGVGLHGVYDRFSEITVSAVEEVYKSKMRQEIENILFGDTDEIDTKDFLEEDKEE